MKPLDMADKYEPLSYQDESRSSIDEYDDPDSEPTVKIQVPTFDNQVVVSEARDTIPCPPPTFEFEGERGEKSYPGIGFLICLVTGVAFWGFIGWLIWG